MMVSFRSVVRSLLAEQRVRFDRGYYKDGVRKVLDLVIRWRSEFSRVMGDWGELVDLVDRGEIGGEELVGLKRADFIKMMDEWGYRLSDGLDAIRRAEDRLKRFLGTVRTYFESKGVGGLREQVEDLVDVRIRDILVGLEGVIDGVEGGLEEVERLANELADDEGPQVLTSLLWDVVSGLSECLDLVEGVVVEMRRKFRM